MKYSMAVSAALMAVALSACDRQPAAAPPVVIAVPGPAGPAGATGSTGYSGAPGSTGDTGAKGATGRTGGDTVIIVPPAAPAR